MLRTAMKALTILLLLAAIPGFAQESGYAQTKLNLVPYPKTVSLNGEDFIGRMSVSVVLPRGASQNDKFSANELLKFFKTDLKIDGAITANAKGQGIVLQKKKLRGIGAEGYTIAVSKNKIEVTGVDDAGLFYGLQTLRQLIEPSAGGFRVRGMNITDWPDTKVRAAHYDTKHHQDTKDYVKSFIRELAAYKMNMLVWEWEDKFEYPSHPQIGAPGAFTMQEMQELTRYARDYHVQIVPLVQGLGHAAFILKWKEFAHLREIPASNFEFCPLKDGSYSLLMDLWKDAMEATPGSKFIHIGSDETYELGKCPQCSKEEKKIGKSGLYHLFLGRSAELLEPSGRGVMTWEAPMGWAKGRLNVYHGGAKDKDSIPPVVPYKGMILTESYNYETPDLKYARQAKSLGYPVYAYDPNPGIEQLFLPYFFVSNKGKIEKGALEESYLFLKETMGKGVFDGVIRTSWDDSGLPMQAWMLSFATTAAFSWNVNGFNLEEFTEAFFNHRHGAQQEEINTLYRLLNEAAYFYMESFERRVWAWGEIGKTHLPDLPRGDAIEYDPYWNTEYSDRLKEAEIFRAKMDTALNIITRNLQKNPNNRYDLEVFETLAQLAKHTALTYQDLSALEMEIKNAHNERFLDLHKAYKHLLEAEKIVSRQLNRREEMFTNLCAVWEKTRLPKGMSTPEKKYFFEQERTRHFANRVPDMSYLIYDEQLLGLEKYLEDLKQYNQNFKVRFDINIP